jgi:hypothetical protein
MVPSRNRTVISRRVGAFTVVVHSAAPPADDEWNRMIDESDPDGPMRALVYTAGGAPNAAQRAKLTALYGTRPLAVAVLTNSALARAAGTALRWFRPELRMFSPSELAAALDHLGAVEPDRGEILRVLQELKIELGLADVRRRANSR